MAAAYAGVSTPSLSASEEGEGGRGSWHRSLSRSCDGGGNRFMPMLFLFGNPAACPAASIVGVSWQVGETAACGPTSKPRKRGVIAAAPRQSGVPNGPRLTRPLSTAGQRRAPSAAGNWATVVACACVVHSSGRRCAGCSPPCTFSACSPCPPASLCLWHSLCLLVLILLLSPPLLSSMATHLSSLFFLCTLFCGRRRVEGAYRHGRGAARGAARGAGNGRRLGAHPYPLHTRCCAGREPPP